MPKIVLPALPRLLAKIMRRAAELGLSPAAYLRKTSLARPQSCSRREGASQFAAEAVSPKNSRIA